MTDRGAAGHIAVALLALLLFAAVHRAVGRIDVGAGEGWDGADYARMLARGWSTGTVYSQLRPLVVLMNKPAFVLTGNAVRAFDLMNHVYAFAFALLVSVLMGRYGASLIDRAVAVACIFLSIGASRLFAYYPVLIDLGACAVMTLAIWLIVSGRRAAAALACVAAVLSREFAPAVLLFGIHRDIRLRTSWPTIGATYLPAAIVYIVLRVAVAQNWDPLDEGNNLALFVENRRLWRDPMFVALFTYFTLTIGGGVALITVAQPSRCWRLLRAEPEWLSYVVPLAVVSGLVGPDIWRYLIFLLPAIVVLFASCAREWSGRERFVLLSAALALTFWTQHPFQRMHVVRYFSDWFPYYIWKREMPLDVPYPSLWPQWGWRFLVVAVSLFVLSVFAAHAAARREAAVHAEAAVR